MPPSFDDRHDRSAFALRFIFAAAGVLGIAGGLAAALIRFAGPRLAAGGIGVLFAASTLLLLSGSVALHRAVHHVRREQQFRFRRALLAALAAGVLFVGVQSCALALLVRRSNPENVVTGAAPFVFTAAALHGLHFALALLFLVFVTLKACMHRYDHEYYWGVVCCAWFWHALGAIWLAILVVLAISGGLAGDEAAPVLSSGLSSGSLPTKLSAVART
ncbi:MAG: cytochrome c oxidase subunit 3 [Planctomycetaceae bacterium]